MRPRWKRLIFIIPAGIVGITLFIFIGGELVMLLWNWLLPPLLGVHTIAFWQAVGILALCRILFGGFGRHGGHSGFRRHWRERCDRMSPEEREKFRQAMRERWGFGPATSESKGQ